MTKKKYPTEILKLLADNLMTGFIPKDNKEDFFSFNFTTDGVNYKAEYSRINNKWVLESVNEAED